MKNSPCRALLLMALAIILTPLFANKAFAQSEIGSAAVEGLISDGAQAPIPNATITLRNQDTGYVRTVQTNDRGRFLATTMPIGVYSIDVKAAGFATARRESLRLSVGTTENLTISLNLAAVNEQVTILAAGEILGTTDTTNNQAISQKAIENLPIRGRNFTEFVQLTPNVMQEQNRFGIVVNGQRSINANISVDGVDFNDPLQNGPRGGGPKESAYFFPQVAIREFQVVRDGASAEVGRTNSGYVNVVTKSGTNRFHGEGLYFNRNGKMTSPDAFGNDSSSNAQHQLGGAVGGPIKKDKLFFFGAVEKNLVTIPYTVKFDNPTGNVTIPQDILAQQGNFDQKNNPLVAFGRIDWTISPRNLVNFQYTYAAQYGLNFGGVSGQTNAASTNNTILDRASQGVKGGITSVLSTSLINEVRAQWVYDNRVQKPNSNLAQVSINDFGTLGGNKDGTIIYEATRNEVLDNLTWTRGLHTVKAGFDFNFSPQKLQRETNYGGAYTFTTLANYLLAVAGDTTKISRYQQSIAANGTQGQYTGTQQDHAVFVTDSIRLRRDLTITAGFRWEGQFNPQPTTPNPNKPITARIANDVKMFQPRLGIAWNVGGRDKTVVRLSSGIFDSRTPAYLMSRVFTDNGLNTLVLDTNTDSTILKYLTVPNPITTLPSGVKTPINSIYAFDPNFRNPRSGQVAIAIEQKIDSSTKMTIGFVRNSTWSLQRRIDTNLFAPTVLSNGLPVYPAYDSKGILVNASGFNTATGQAIFIDTATGKAFSPKVARPDATLGQINVNMSVGHSSYNGFSLSVERRFSKRLQFAFNYTHAFSRDDDTNERDFNRQGGLNTYNLKMDASWSKNDIRNSGNFHALYDLGRGFQISTLLFARTGYPVKPVVGADTQNDGNTVNDRPIINGYVTNRAGFLQPGFFDWDMRLTKEFRIKESMKLVLTIEGFNLTRSSNKQFNGDGETSFGAPTATVNANTGLNFANNTALIPTFAPGTDRFGGPRQGQLGLRFVF